MPRKGCLHDLTQGFLAQGIAGTPSRPLLDSGWMIPVPVFPPITVAGQRQILTALPLKVKRWTMVLRLYHYGPMIAIAFFAIVKAMMMRAYLNAAMTYSEPARHSSAVFLVMKKIWLLRYSQEA